MVSQFLFEASVFGIIFLILKKIWSPSVKYWMGQIVIGINIFACLLYVYGIYGGTMTLGLGSSKILLHAIVAIIIHTLFTIQSSNEHE